jgi:hypothetical protein
MTIATFSFLPVIKVPGRICDRPTHHKAGKEISGDAVGWSLEKGSSELPSQIQTELSIVKFKIITILLWTYFFWQILFPILNGLPFVGHA